MSREYTIGGGYRWVCKKCGMSYDDMKLSIGGRVRKEHLHEIRNGDHGEALKEALSIFPDDDIGVLADTYKCPHCHNLQFEKYIFTHRPSFNEYVLKKHEHHLCKRCNHEMIQLTNEDRNHGLTCPRCGARMKIRGHIVT